MGHFQSGELPTAASDLETPAVPCWGGQLQLDGGVSCTPGFIPKLLFKSKFCVNCRRDGILVRSRWRPGFAPSLETPEQLVGDAEDGPREPDAVDRAQVPAPAIRELAALLVRLEAWEQEMAEDEIGRLDDSRSRLTLRVDGGESRIWEYSQDRVRLQQVKLALERMVDAHRIATPNEGVDEAEAEPPLVEAGDER